MPVIAISAPDLLEPQKRVIAKRCTEVVAQQAGVSPDRVSVFFQDVPRDAVATGGVLQSEAPAPPAGAEQAPHLPPLSQNAVLGDRELQAGLRKLNADFAELCISASGEAYGTPLLDQRTKVLLAIAVDVVELIQGPPFHNHLAMAVKQGITRAELEELLLFLTIYAGFNKAGTFYPELERFFGPREPPASP